eukprot:TRINITY_DN6553_c0_g1_i6.p1 TRINITY_DN6553_c0_g1~~TRINITY_DN6553_c0_g1_i6.p1  ORF type:complete len:142 (-),score=15.57 TRINITY_DN6553_c0_g1_i6:214-639(-)
MHDLFICSTYLNAYESRDATIGAGFDLLGQHFDVHRFHPPLIYGRRGNADEGEGISLARGTTKTGKKVFLLITYVLPIISARAVPQQIKFYQSFVGELDKFQERQHYDDKFVQILRSPTGSIPFHIPTTRPQTIEQVLSQD